MCRNILVSICGCNKPCDKVGIKPNPSRGDKKNKCLLHRIMRKELGGGEKRGAGEGDGKQY